MRLALFYHSLVSDWNHGNAHFLRGIASELVARGHAVEIFEPRGSWSRANLIADHGEHPLRDFELWYPGLKSRMYDPDRLDLDEALEGVDLAIVHEWNDRETVRRVGEHRARSGRYRLLFHDTHHRAATDPAEMARYDLSRYDGVLAFGEVIRRIYLDRNWTRKAWTWHEAADIRVFRPLPCSRFLGDLVWVGNWGDGERTGELHEFLIRPVAGLKLRARVHGVRYPESGRQALAAAGIEYGGWLANFRVPELLSRYRATIHVPRRPYRGALRGIPTIRVFEALACGIPLVCADWDDCEGLFRPGKDYLVAQDGAAMVRHLRSILHDPAMAEELAEHGRRTILRRHTCAHRVDELLEICRELELDTRPEQAVSGARLSSRAETQEA